jgi:hypothetical protein
MSTGLTWPDLAGGVRKLTSPLRNGSLPTQDGMMANRAAHG